MSWFKEVGEKVADPAFSNWFILFRNGGAADFRNGSWHVKPCTKGVCSRLYHSQDQIAPGFDCCGNAGKGQGKCSCGGAPCGTYLFDHRNASLRAWLVSEFVMGSNGMGNANVSGFYLDDFWQQSGEDWSDGVASLTNKTARDVNPSVCATGPSEVEQHCLQDAGLSAADVAELNAGWRLTMTAAMRAVVAAGGFVWQMFDQPSWRSRAATAQRSFEKPARSAAACRRMQSSSSWRLSRTLQLAHRP